MRARFQKFAVALSLTVGVLLVILGATWKHWRSPQMLWSRDQAREYTEAYLALKAATAEGPRPASRSDDAKLVAAKARFNKSEEQLNRAAALNDYAGTAMVVAGVGLIALLWWLRFSHTGSFDPE